jgi:hypothetical protein
MGWFDFLRTRAHATPSRATVTFDDDAVTCRRPDGLVETVRWADLQIVYIQATDGGPYDDVFWVLGGGDKGCVVHGEAEGMNVLLERLQRLPGFDSNAVIQAMSCTDNQAFVCWKRP